MLFADLFLELPDSDTEISDKFMQELIDKKVNYLMVINFISTTSWNIEPVVLI
jgi:hypothetical protein